MSASAVASPQPVAAKTTLFVCDLPKDQEDIENILYRHFGSAGSIVSTKACRDMHTSRLLGHGYVNFQNAADAEKALSQLNFSEILPGKPPIRVSWSQRDPAARKMGTGNVFVKELDDSVTNKVLFDAFSAIGPIASCKLSLDESGKTKHYGFVHFEKPEHAEKCIEMAEAEQLLVGGRAVKCESFKKRQDRDAEAAASFCDVYVKNLKPEAKGADVKDLFAQFEESGKAASEEVPFCAPAAPFDTQFALVTMGSHEAAVRAIDALHEKEHPLAGEGKKLYVVRAQSKKERAAAKQLASQQALLQNQGKNLYVKHLDDNMNDDMLRQLFSPYGAIQSASIARFPDSGASRGYGFVVFEAKESAANAQRDLHNKVIGTRPLYVAVAQNREARVKMLEQQTRNRSQAAGFGPGGPGGMMGGPGGLYGMPPAGAYGGAGAAFPGAFPGGPYPAMRGGRGGVGNMPPNMPMLNNLRPGQNMPGGRGGMPPMNMRGGMMGGPQGGMAPNMMGGPMGGFPGQPGMMGGAPRGGYNGPRGGGVPRGGAGAPQGGQAGAGAPQPQQVAGIPMDSLMKMSPEDQKNTLGERLFLQVQNINQPQAAKITGMLLEMEVSEIIHIIEHEPTLRAKVNEALAVLRDYGASADRNQ